MGGKTALVAGATGVTGRNLLQHLEGCRDWDALYGASRRPLECGEQVKHVPVDMTDPADVTAKFGGLGGVTHVFFCGFQMRESPEKDVDINFGMFKNVVEGLEAAGAQLQHVHFVSGTKWYGNSIGPIKTPSRETDRVGEGLEIKPHINFYYNMEDYCIDRVNGGAMWTWGSVRPNPVCGFSTGSAMNLTMTLAVYASLCKAEGRPFTFPGSEAAYNALLEVVDADLLSCAMVWIATAPAEVQNNSYNVSNGDIFRWSEIWPKLAEYFGLEVGAPQPFNMTQAMAGKQAAWEALQQQYSLASIAYKDIATWGFGDWVFGQEKDWFSSVLKLRRAGFHKLNIDNLEMFTKQFDELKKNKVIPQ